MSRIRRLAPGLGRGGLIGNTEGPEAYLRALDLLPSQFCRASGGTETVINQSGRYYRVHTYTDTDPTSLLLNFDGSNGSTTFTDDSGWGHAVTANGNAQISTAQSVFGGSSAYFDGTGDYLESPGNAVFSFGTGDFTVEFWLNPSAISTDTVLIDTRAGLTDAGFACYFVGSGQLNFQSSGASRVNSGADVLSTGSFQHVAYTRSSGTLYLFLDGQQVGTASYASSITNPGNLRVGANLSGAAPFNGYIDSLRITKGQALYTAAFTPPTTALTRVGSGSLTFTRGGSVEYLVVGGGGGAGFSAGGGGGAGGFRSGVSVINKASIAVGGGGSAGVSVNAASNGAGSFFGSVSSSGGGKGGDVDSGSGEAGSAGGSGGGGSGGQVGGSGNTPSVSPPQGNTGGTAATAPSFGAGGGGGASAVGGNASGDAGGNGGDGTASVISGSSVTYAGGGGGGSNANATAGAGGSGGGGNGGASSNAAGSNGTANTGGGGGGGRNDTVAAAGGSGGSGIVIARYRITQAEYEAEAA